MRPSNLNNFFSNDGLISSEVKQEIFYEDLMDDEEMMDVGNEGI
jgi:hypothetical protein